MTLQKHDWCISPGSMKTSNSALRQICHKKSNISNMYLVLVFVLKICENASGSCDKFCHEIKFFKM